MLAESRKALSAGLAFILAAALFGLSSCAIAPTQETLVDAAGNHTYCASEASVNSVLNTTIIHACTTCGTATKCVNPDGSKTQITVVTGNSVGSAVLSSGQAAIGAIPVAAAVGLK